MQIRQIRRLAALAGVLALWVMPIAARGAVTQSGVLKITASDGVNSKTLLVPVPGNPTFTSPFTTTQHLISDTGPNPGTELIGLDITLFFDFSGTEPCIDLNFNTTTDTFEPGQADKHPDVAVSITSPTLSGFSFTNPTTDGSAGVTLTDWPDNSDPPIDDGATITGLQPTPNMTFAGLANGLHFLGGDILPGFSVVPTDSQSNSDVLAATVPGVVTSMNSSWFFDLTLNDAASGTSVYCLVPEPGSLGLLAIAGSLLLRRRHA